MHALMNVRNILLAVATIAVVTWAFTTNTSSNYQSTVIVSKNNDALIVESLGNCGKEKGCIKPKKNKAATITFKIRGKGFLNNKYNCDDNGHKWYLTKIELAGKDALTKPTSWPGTVDAQVQSDFGADAAGNVPFVVEKGHKIVINDKNGTDKPRGSPQAAPYDIWYRLTATCNDVNPIYSDPRIRNTGHR